MPSAKSRRRQQSGAARNKPIRTKARTAVAQARTAIEAAAASDEAQAAVKAAASALDRAATKGVIHPNNAARRKSRLAKRLNKASAGA